LLRRLHVIEIALGAAELWCPNFACSAQCEQRHPGSARLYHDHPLAPAEGKAPEPDETSLGHRRADHPERLDRDRTIGINVVNTMGIRSLLAMALVDGAFVCLPRFDAAAALWLIGRDRVTSLYLVPTLYHDLISYPGFAAADTGSVRKIGFAGATMPDGLLKRVETAFQPELFVNHYGSPEIHLHDRAAGGGEARLGRQGGDQPAHPSRQARRRSSARRESSPLLGPHRAAVGWQNRGCARYPRGTPEHGLERGV
jgi:hypothetical protein